MRDLEPDEQTSVRTDALPAVDSDIRAWCRTAGHELTGVEERDTERRYGIRKTGRPRTQPPWALTTDGRSQRLTSRRALRLPPRELASASFLIVRSILLLITKPIGSIS
jgi:hypothetical protein